MSDEIQETSRRGCGCGSLVTMLVMVLAALGLIWGLLVASTPSLLRSGVLTPALQQAAEEISSGVATATHAVLPTATGLIESADLRTTSPHIVPTTGSKIEPKTIKFSYDGVKYSITPHVDSGVYWGARRSTAYMTSLPGESKREWTQAYYHAYADDPAQKPAIEDVVRQLRAIRDRAHLTNDQYLEVIAKYVQSIPYDWKRYSSGTGTQRFPVQTLVDGIGLCGDKSVLLADLLSHEGYGVALLDFGPEKHMAVGVLGDGRTYASSGYLFLETTAPCYVTDVPDQYAGGMKLHSEPIVIAIGQGTRTYGAADQIARIIAVRDSAQSAGDALYRSAKAQLLTNAQVRLVNSKLETTYKAQTSLRSNVVDRNGKSIGTFLDRPLAIRWIDRNAWWM